MGSNWLQVTDLVSDCWCKNVLWLTPNKSVAKSADISLKIFQSGPYLPSIDVVQDEVEHVWGLEREMEPHQERML